MADIAHTERLAELAYPLGMVVGEHQHSDAGILQPIDKGVQRIWRQSSLVGCHCAVQIDQHAAYAVGSQHLRRNIVNRIKYIIGNQFAHSYTPVNTRILI